MEHTPPPFFKRGPAPLVRLFFFASLSLALLVLDARFRYAEGLRSSLALIAYPLQRAATAPIDFFTAVGDYFSTQAQLVEDNATLRGKTLELSQAAQRYEAAVAEAAQLRRLIGAAEKLEVKARPAEVLYAGRDPYSHKVFINLGENHGVKPGSPVTDESGVVGQVTRVHPLISEVTLVTDQDQAVPIQVVRNGLRAIAFGGGASGHARAAVHGRQCRDPERRPPGHLGHRRHLSCRTAGSHGSQDRARRRAQLCPGGLQAGGRRGPRALRAGAFGRDGTPAAAGGGAAGQGAALRQGQAQPRQREGRLMPLGARSEHILRPARVSTIALSFAIALLLNFLPWKDLRLVPDFVALVLTFWCVRQPRLVGLGVAWTIGLLVDAGNGVLLGQHALAYSLLAFLSIWLSRRILWFGPMLQAGHVALMLAVAQSLVLVVRIAAGDPFPGWAIYVSPLAGAVLWPMVSWLLTLPQRRLDREQTI